MVLKNLPAIGAGIRKRLKIPVRNAGPD